MNKKEIFDMYGKDYQSACAVINSLMYKIEQLKKVKEEDEREKKELKEENRQMIERYLKNSQLQISRDDEKLKEKDKIIDELNVKLNKIKEIIY